jgi:hypothetical protein
MHLWINIKTIKNKVGRQRQGEWGHPKGRHWVLWSLCVLGCISTVIVEGACVRDCRGLGDVYIGMVS